MGESFRQVSDRLEQVYRGLGEMRRLAAGVGDLKRVLTNVKTRGTWGEVQLGAGGPDVTPLQRVGAAIQAGVLVLELSIDWYRSLIHI